MTRKPKPKRRRLELVSRRVDNQALSAMTVELGGHEPCRIAIDVSRPQPQAPKNNTLKLPDAVNVPSFPKLGGSFKCQFKTYQYMGERLEQIGAVRKRKVALWGTQVEGRRTPAIIGLPIEGGKVLERDIAAKLEAIIAKAPIRKLDCEAKLVWDDDYHTAKYLQRYRG